MKTSKQYNSKSIEQIKQIPGTPTLNKRQVWILYFIYHLTNENGARFTDLEQTHLMSPTTLSKHIKYLTYVCKYLSWYSPVPAGEPAYFLTARGRNIIKRLYPKDSDKELNNINPVSVLTEKNQTLDSIQKQFQNINDALKVISNSCEAIRTEIQHFMESSENRQEK